MQTMAGSQIPVRSINERVHRIEEVMAKAEDILGVEQDVPLDKASISAGLLGELDHINAMLGAIESRAVRVFEALGKAREVTIGGQTKGG